MQAEQAYLFRHAVMRDVAYQLIVPSERGELHGLALDAWEAGDAPDQYAAELADHARLAGELARELKYLRVAAPLTRAQWHNVAAAALYLRLASHPDSTVDERVDALLRRCDALDAAGDATGALAAAQEAVALAHGSDPLLARARYQLAHQLVSHARFTEAYETATAALDDARRAGDRPVEIRTLIIQARALHRLGRGDEGEQLARRAIEYSAATGDELFAASMRCSAAFVLFSSGHTAEGAKLLEAAADVVARGNADTYAQVLAGIGTTRLQLGDPDGALAHLNRALKFAREIGHRRTQAMCHTNLGVYFYERGQYLVAEGHYQQALAAHRELGNRASEALVLGNLTGFYSTRNDLPRSIDCGRRALRIAQETEDMPQQLNMLGYLARALWQTGRLAAAEAAVRDGLRRGQGSAAVVELSALQALLATFLVFTGRAADADRELERAEALHSRLSDPGHWARYILPSESRALLARADIAGARKLLDQLGERFGEFARDLRDDAVELENALAERRAPMLWGGMRISAMRIALRRALAACLQSSDHGRAAISAAPEAFAKLAEGMEDVPLPAWARPDWLQE